MRLHAEDGTNPMLLRPSAVLERALRDLSQLTDGEQVYWLGYKEKNGVVTVETAVQVPGVQTNRDGRFGFERSVQKQ